MENLQSALDDQQRRPPQDGTEPTAPSLPVAVVASDAGLQSFDGTTEPGQPQGGSRPTSRPNAIVSPIRRPEAQFHGPTSAMFDGDQSQRTGNVGLGMNVNVFEKNQLLAEATKQRMISSEFLIISCGH